MTDSTPKVKTPPHPTGAPVAAKYPDMAEFLTVNPLPPKLRPLLPYLQKIPLQGFLSLVFNASASGFDDAKINEGVRSLAEFEDQDSHRCAACLYWVDRAHSYGIGSIIGGNLHYFVVCEKCHDSMMAAGKPTPQQERNMRSYVGVTE